MPRDYDEEFEDFVRAVMPRLRRLAIAWCGPQSHRADDLVQSALERVYASWPRVVRRQDAVAYARTTMLRMSCMSFSQEKLARQVRCIRRASASTTTVSSMAIFWVSGPALRTKPTVTRPAGSRVRQRPAGDGSWEDAPVPITDRWRPADRPAA